jgi:bacterial/archaeal transporter family-2 protein
MNASWIIPFIILGGALQSCGAAMNGQLNKYIVNPWLASAVSFAFLFAGATLIMPHPLPTSKDLASLPCGPSSAAWLEPYKSTRGLRLSRKWGPVHSWA